jgi:hypothetical protein
VRSRTFWRQTVYTSPAPRKKIICLCTTGCSSMYNMISCSDNGAHWAIYS